MRSASYDFLNWKSFPSSIKLLNDEVDGWTAWHEKRLIPVSPGPITVKVQQKQENVLHTESMVHFDGWDGKEWRYLSRLTPPKLGTFNWTELITESIIPLDISVLRYFLAGGAGSPEVPGITWFDDLEVYQNGVIIFREDFSNWSPIIGAGVGAPIGGVAGYLLKEPLGPMVSEVVGAVVGGAVGGGVGLLTGLGIIPVPQIPSLGAAPEGPGAPMRLGKYLITG